MYIMEGYIFLSIIVVVVGIWIAWYVAKQFKEAAKMKGHDQTKYFWLCFLLGAVGYLLVIALPDRSDVQKTANDELPDL